MYFQQASPDDAQEIAECVQEAYQHYIARIGGEPGPMQDDYALMIAQHSVWVMRDGGVIAGILVLIEKEEGLLLDNVAVRPKYQGRGIGRKLISFAEQEAIQRGYDNIFLYTHEKMHENIDLYRRNGYVEFDRRVELGLRRIYMRKRVGVKG